VSFARAGSRPKNFLAGSQARRVLPQLETKFRICSTVSWIWRLPFGVFPHAVAGSAQGAVATSCKREETFAHGQYESCRGRGHVQESGLLQSMDPQGNSEHQPIVQLAWSQMPGLRRLTCSPLQEHWGDSCTPLLQVIAEGMELGQSLCDTASLKTLLHRKHLNPCCGNLLAFEIPFLETFATPTEIIYINTSRGIFQGVKPYKTGRRWSRSRRDVARRLGENGEQGWRPGPRVRRVYSREIFGGTTLTRRETKK
jgi:hypothetical protein